MNLADNHVRPFPILLATVSKNFLAPITRIEDVLVVKRQLGDGASILTAPASNVPFLIVANSLQVLQSHKTAFALPIPIVAVGVPRGQSGTIRAHKFGYIRTEDLFSQEALHRPVNSRITECAALNNNVIAQNRRVGDFQDLVDGILDHRVSQPGGNIADFSAFSQGLFYF